MPLTAKKIKEMKVAKDAALRKQYDFAVMSIEQMQAIDPPGELLRRAAWNNILQDKIKRQKEIADLSFTKDFFDKFGALSDADKVKMFETTKDGTMRLKTKSEFKDAGITSSVRGVG